MHKVYVGTSDGHELAIMAEGLKNEWLPDYLNAGG